LFNQCARQYVRAVAAAAEQDDGIVFADRLGEFAHEFGRDSAIVIDKGQAAAAVNHAGLRPFIRTANIRKRDALCFQCDQLLVVDVGIGGSLQAASCNRTRRGNK